MSAPAPVHGNAVFDARGDPDARPAHLDEAGSLGVHVDAELDLHRAELVGCAAVAAYGRARQCFSSFSNSAVASKKKYRGMKTIIGVKGSTPGVRKLAATASARNQ